MIDLTNDKELNDILAKCYDDWTIDYRILGPTWDEVKDFYDTLKEEEECY